MKSARVVFKGGIPFSPEFDDIYFNADDPIGQSEYVFNSIFDGIWSKKDEFNILETGFGAGLNFLCAFKRFKNSDKFLNFVSIEANPISKEDLAKIYASFSELADVSNELLSAYPPLIRGFHRLNLAPNVTLTLCFSAAAEVLCELSFTADAVFMDGFAPSKNEAIWSEEICAKVANLCAPGAAVCTYSASGALKRALQNSGFEVDSLKGYGKKREMLRAKFAGESSAEKEIWFSRFDRSRAISSKPKTALIIGGGVAGCVCAFKLHERGLDVAIAEKRGDIALNGSGNHCGILMPLITKPAVNLGRMHMNAFLQAARFYERNLSAEQIEFCGAKDYAYEPKTLERFLEWSEFDADNGVFELNFNDEPYASAFIFRGAKAHPRKMCKAASTSIKTLLNCEFTGFETLEGGAVRAHFKDGRSIDADVLVLALGSESMELLADYDIRLSSVRGQVTHIAPAVPACAPFSAKGYVCPPAEGVQVIGATYDRNLFLDEPRASDDDKNLADIAEFLGGEFTENDSANLTFCGENLTDGPDGDAKNAKHLFDASDEKISCKFESEQESGAGFADGKNSLKTGDFASDFDSAKSAKTNDLANIRALAAANGAVKTDKDLNLANSINLYEKVERLSSANLGNSNLKYQNQHANAQNSAQTKILDGSDWARVQNLHSGDDANSFDGAARVNLDEKSEALNSTNLKERIERLNLSESSGTGDTEANLNAQIEGSNLINLDKSSDAHGSSDAIRSNLTQPKNSPKAATKIPSNIRIIGSKVGYRSYSGDRFPLIGRLYDEDYYKQAYKSLLWTKNGANPPPKYAPNVYVSAAHGSRGLCTAALGAELICDLIFDRPLCIEKSLFDELHLARFLIRKLKKGLK